MNIFYIGKKIIPKQFKPFAKKLESAIYFVSAMGIDFTKWKKYFSLKGAHRYMYMQHTIYEHQAQNSKYDNKENIKNELVVGSFDEHNNWPDYDLFLMKYVDSSYKNKIALDFACGPGRCIIKYNDRFLRIDGVDISKSNINNAKTLIRKAGLQIPKLYVSSGDNLGRAQKNYYDFIFSTIAMQHICVHKIRFNILKNMYKCLKIGGRLSIQMAYGTDEDRHLGSVGYYDNYYNALSTNSQHDCRVENPEQVKSDLTSIGFKNFKFWIRPAGPGCSYENWIYFTAIK